MIENKRVEKATKLSREDLYESSIESDKLGFLISFQVADIVQLEEDNPEPFWGVLMNIEQRSNRG